MGHLTVRDVMTPTPVTIGLSQPLAAAHRMMQEFRVRHLPVLDHGRLVGIVSQRDLHFIETLRDVDPKQVTVDEAMTADPYTTTPLTHLRTAVKAMAEQRIGSAVVVDEERVVGVFTTTDALTLLARMLD
jgi:acetoin utilization protein AcuB